MNLFVGKQSHLIPLLSRYCHIRDYEALYVEEVKQAIQGDPFSLPSVLPPFLPSFLPSSLPFPSLFVVIHLLPQCISCDILVL